MRYTARRPVGRLHGIVDRLWYVEDAAPLFAAETICPDGRTEIVLHLGSPMRECSGLGHRLQPRYLLVGQMSAALTVMPTGPVAMVGARLAPAALRRLIGISQGRLAGEAHDLEAIWPAWTRRAIDQIGSVGGGAARLCAFEHALESLIPASALVSPDQSLDEAVRRLQATGGNGSIERLAHDAGVSRRQFERRFRQHVGLPPRVFGRIVRFQRAFHALGVESGASIAARCGYVDQAHLVREIRRFSGYTPTLLAEATGLTAFLRMDSPMEGGA